MEFILAINHQFDEFMISNHTTNKQSNKQSQKKDIEIDNAFIPMNTKGKAAIPRPSLLLPFSIAHAVTVYYSSTPPASAARPS